MSAKKSKEIDSRSIDIEQRDSIEMPGLDEEFEPDIVVVKAREKQFHKEQAEAIKFSMEPVTIYIHPQSGELAPKVVDCWVNGKGAEKIENGRWVQYGALPVGYKIITRRMYVEVLASSKRTSWRTRVDKTNPDDVKNFADPTTSLNASFSVLHDANEKLGPEWLRRILSHA